MGRHTYAGPGRWLTLASIAQDDMRSLSASRWPAGSADWGPLLELSKAMLTQAPTSTGRIGMEVMSRMLCLACHNCSFQLSMWSSALSASRRALLHLQARLDLPAAAPR